MVKNLRIESNLEGGEQLRIESNLDGGEKLFAGGLAGVLSELHGQGLERLLRPLQLRPKVL